MTPPHAQGSFSTQMRSLGLCTALPAAGRKGPGPTTAPQPRLHPTRGCPDPQHCSPQHAEPVPGLEDRSPHPPPSASPIPSLCLSSSRTLPYGAVARRLYSFSCQLLQARTSGTLWGPRTPIALSSDVCPSH